MSGTPEREVRLERGESEALQAPKDLPTVRGNREHNGHRARFDSQVTTMSTEDQHSTESTQPESHDQSRESQKASRCLRSECLHQDEPAHRREADYGSEGTQRMFQVRVPEGTGQLPDLPIGASHRCGASGTGAEEPRGLGSHEADSREQLARWGHDAQDPKVLLARAQSDGRQLPGGLSGQDPTWRPESPSQAVDRALGQGQYATGKHQGHTFLETWEEDQQYVRWSVQETAEKHGSSWKLVQLATWAILSGKVTNPFDADMDRRGQPALAVKGHPLCLQSILALDEEAYQKSEPKATVPPSPERKSETTKGSTAEPSNAELVLQLQAMKQEIRSLREQHGEGDPQRSRKTPHAGL